MITQTRVYTLPVDTPGGIIHLPVTHTVIDENEERMWVTLSVDVQAQMVSVDAETTEEALIKLVGSFPGDWRIHSCLSCRYGHFCPVGNADNEVFCVTEFEPEKVSDLWQVTEDEKERAQRSRTLFHTCDKYAQQSEAYFTYNDYYSAVHKLETQNP